MMKNLIYQPGSENLAVSCKAIGMDRSVFLAIYKHIRMMRDQNTDLTDEETKRVNTMYSTMDKDEADKMLRPWRQGRRQPRNPVSPHDRPRPIVAFRRCHRSPPRQAGWTPPLAHYIYRYTVRPMKRVEACIMADLISVHPQD